MKQVTSGPWGMLLTHLSPLATAERSYLDLGSMVTKNKGFLRKDVSNSISSCSLQFSNYCKLTGLIFFPEFSTIYV